MVEINDIITAYSNTNFMEMIEKKRVEIEGLLYSFIDEVSDRKMSNKIISRIKSKESLKEKLERKNYIEEWNLESCDAKSIQSAICKELPDLLGFRLNCYFKNDEKIIYEALEKHLKTNESIELEESPNHKQSNGHDIYKIAGKYKEINNSFSFEIQVKSLIHDTWGEVEHSIIYKSMAYDSCSELKKGVIEGLYNVLEGADKQLQKLYAYKSNIDAIKLELFYHLTNDNSIMGIHYQNFLNLKPFFNQLTRVIDRYIGSKLLENEFYKESIESDIEINLAKYKERINGYKWKKICDIAKNIYDFTDNDHFLKYTIKQIIDSSKSTDEEETPFIEEATEEDKEQTLVFTTLSFLLEKPYNIGGEGDE